ncbi:helix-turn-helix transcriptional regulator [Roseivivax jejudonensis]|nr:autoinducer binding domain-containing protein [Roseivivax jejudonensis]
MLTGLESADSHATLQAVSEDLRTDLDVSHVVYHWVSGSGDQYGCGTYDPAWVERYMEKGYLRIDPVVLGCFQSFHPVDWKQLDWTSRAARAFLADAVAHGVGNQGFSVPIRGPNGQFALFTINHFCDDEVWARFTGDRRRDLILLANAFNQKALELQPGRRPQEAAALSPREVEALTLLALGHNRAQVADTLSISEHTLRVYIESARHKLGAINTTHAVARALQRGAIVL